MEDFLKFINMDAKSRAERDMGDYKPGEGLEREGLQGVLDNILRQSDAVQQSAGKLYVDETTSSTGAANRLLELNPDFEVTPETSTREIRRATNNAEEVTSLYRQLESTGENTGKNRITKSDAFEMGPDGLSAALTGAKGRQKDTNFNEDPETQYRILRDNEARDRQILQDNRIAFEQSENRKMQAHQFDMNMLNKNAQLDLQRLELAGRREDRRMAREDRQAEKRQASIRMLIEGLSKLGAGFSI